MDEKRVAFRKRSLLSGRVVIGNAMVYDCTIRDLSDTGAKLAFATPTSTPDEFKLQLLPQQRSMWVRVAWRKGTAIGVQFIQEEEASRVA